MLRIETNNAAQRNDGIKYELLCMSTQDFQ
jgi:hypothetical protein